MAGMLDSNNEDKKAAIADLSNLASMYAQSDLDSGGIMGVPKGDTVDAGSWWSWLTGTTRQKSDEYSIRAQEDLQGMDFSGAPAGYQSSMEEDLAKLLRMRGEAGPKVQTSVEQPMLSDELAARENLPVSELNDDEYFLRTGELRETLSPAPVEDDRPSTGLMSPDQSAIDQAVEEEEETSLQLETPVYPSNTSEASSYSRVVYPENPQAAAALAATIEKEGMSSRSENISLYKWSTITDPKKDAGFIKPSITSSKNPWAIKRTSKLYELYGGSPVLDSEGNQKPLTRNPTKEELKKVQQELKNTGYYSGGIDGDFGVLSKSALKKWQSSKDISPTGVLNVSTLRALGVDIVLKDHEGNDMVEYTEPANPKPPSGEKVADIVYNPYYRANGYSDAKGDVLKQGQNIPGSATWRGRGPVQITNKENYEAIAPFVLSKTGIDIMKDPDAVADNDAVSYWSTVAHLDRIGFGKKGTAQDWIKSINPNAKTLAARVSLYNKLLPEFTATNYAPTQSPRPKARK